MELTAWFHIAIMLILLGVLYGVPNNSSAMKPKIQANHLIPRRQFSQTALMAGGIGLSLPHILQLQAASSQPPTDTAVIQVWLGGGHSQFETFDPKPMAPAEIRGPYKAIPTCLPGVSFCEKIPNTAQVIDRAAIIRSVTHTANGHFVASHWCSTGYAGTKGTASHPSSGSIAAKFRGPNHPGLPAYVLLSEEFTKNPGIAEVMGPGHLGTSQSPFLIEQDPFRSEFLSSKVNDATTSLKLVEDVTLDRLSDRRSLLQNLDRITRAIDNDNRVRSTDQFNEVALEMVTSGKALRAFDLSREPKSIHALYGKHRWGQTALLARRLVEAGVTFVTINTAPDSLCWDWHRNIVNDKRPADGSDGPNRGMDISGPPLDQMLSALVTDLYQRGLDKKVLLLVWGEFGRTPRINKTGGRDHWCSLMSILMAGGSLQVGQVIGASTKYGEVPTERPISPTDVLATVYRHLGINPRQQTVTPEGRPIPLLPDGKPISELI